MYRINLNEGEHTLLVNVLHLAATEYDKMAKQLRESVEPARERERENPEKLYIITADGYERLAEQFDTQAADTRKLIEKIDDAESL